jgi:ceramide glucosyltransferase
MCEILGIALFAATATGLALLGLQLGSLRRHLRESRPEPRRFPGISILKPLCGLDDGLVENLTRFARLDYPDYELLLGVRSHADAAWPLARDMERRFPGRVRVVVQRGEPGRNPKVNQLCTLAAAARHELLVVSDSNIAVAADYLREIAAHLEHADVGLVTHPVAGVGERRLGSLLDNLHLSGGVGPGMVGAKRVLGWDIVVGKSMALRRADLSQLGGFESVADVLAEDYVLGERVAALLHKRVVVAHRAVLNVSERRSVADFVARYRRWCVIHRRAVGLWVYLGEPLVNPTPLAAVAAALIATTPAFVLMLACIFSKIALDGASGRALRGRGFGWRRLLWVPLMDTLLLAAWWHGLIHRTVEWRSNRLVVGEGTRLLGTERGVPRSRQAELLEDAV